MSEGDKILIQTVLKVGRVQADQDDNDDQDEGCPGHLTDLSANQILESVARCLNVIMGDRSTPKEEEEPGSQEVVPGIDVPPFHSVRPPVSMSARFNMGSKCAQCCLELGYPDKDLGYQAFLYSNQKELRNIFMFLVDKLPKEEQNQDKDVDFIDEVKQNVASVISTQLKSEWKPPIANAEKVCDEFCSCELCLDEVEDVLSILPSETWASYAAGSSKFKSKRWPPPRSQTVIISSIINANDELNNGTTTDGDVIKNADEVDGIPVRHLQTSCHPADDDLTSSDDVIASSSSLIPVTSSLAGTTHHLRRDGRIKNAVNGSSEDGDEVVIKDALDEGGGAADKGDDAGERNQLEALNMQRLTLEKEIEEIKLAYKTRRDEGIQKRAAIVEGHELIGELSIRLEKETRAAEKRDKLLTLLPDYDQNLAKLMDIVKKNKEKLANLRQQWDEHVFALETEHETLISDIALQEENSTRKLSRREILAKEISEFEEEIKNKDLMEAKFRKEVVKLFKGKNFVSRSSYTKQIMDILKNVTRQRHQTSKVIQDIKVTQNDINLLEGKLYRTYVDADAKIFNLAKQDGQLVPTYRILTEIHKNCEEIIECIRQTGQVKRATRTANDQADVERTKNVSSNISQLSNDLKQVKAENRQIREKVTAAAAAAVAK